MVETTRVQTSTCALAFRLCHGKCYLAILMYLNTYIHMTDTCLSRRHRSRKSTYFGRNYVPFLVLLPTFAYYSETKKYQDQHRLIRVISIMKANRKRETLAYNTILLVGST